MSKFPWFGKPLPRPPAHISLGHQYHQVGPFVDSGLKKCRFGNPSFGILVYQKAWRPESMSELILSIRFGESAHVLRMLLSSQVSSWISTPEQRLSWMLEMGWRF